jgi:uncharacterized HAD superfamily protein
MAAVQQIVERYDWAVVTARGESARRLTEAWLVRNFGALPRVHMRSTWKETPAQFKVRVISELNAEAHFEDDPFTAAWVAEIGTRVFLVDWPRNRDLSGSGITRVESVASALAHLD